MNREDREDRQGTDKGFISLAQRAGGSLTHRPDAHGAEGEVCCRGEARPGAGGLGLKSRPGVLLLHVQEDN